MPPPPLNLYKLPGWIIPLTRYSSAWFTSGDFRVIQPLGHLQPSLGALGTGPMPAAGLETRTAFKFQRTGHRNQLVLEAQVWTL